MIRLAEFDRSYRDFSRDYINCIVEAFEDNNPEKTFPFFIGDMAANSEYELRVITGSVLSNKNRDSCAWVNKHYDPSAITIRDWFPEPKAYAHGPAVVFLFYSPTRQYGRSYNRNIGVIGIPTVLNMYYGGGIRARQSTDANLISSFYHDVSMNYEDGVNSLLNGQRLAYPLFDYFYCMLSPVKTKHPIKVFCENICIGEVAHDSSEKSILLYKSHSYMQDVFRDNKFTNLEIVNG